MIQYVAGLLLSDLVYMRGTRVVLINKHKPEWQKGKLNAVGGKINEGEEPDAAMSREFHEETGVLIPPAQWEHFLTLDGQDGRWRVYFYRTIGDVFKARTMEEEEVSSYPVDALYGLHTIPNIKWIVPMALDIDLQVPIHVIDEPKVLMG